LREYIVNLLTFEEKSMIGEPDKLSHKIYHRVEDGVLVLVRSIRLSESVEQSRLNNEIENLINLQHPCITAPIGFVFPIESDRPQELKIVELYSEGISLSEVVSLDPIWWTSTMKAKAIAGIVLGLRFAHSFGLLHKNLSTRTIVFDSDHCIQIVDFEPQLMEVDESECQEGTQVGGFSGEGWTPKTDVSGFASILFEIIVGRPSMDEISVPTNIPTFICDIIERGLWLKSEREFSLDDIFNILKKNEFRIADDVDSAEVSAFIKWIEFAEHPET
jgi:serine/threonine protein kinase